MNDNYPFNVVPGQQRWRWDLNPRKTCAFTRFRVLRTTVHHRPPRSLTRHNRQPTSASKRLWTGVRPKLSPDPAPEPGLLMSCPEAR
jgi:hypothetical protein